MKMLIDSQWVEASDGAWMDIRNPGTGKVIDRVPRATLEDTAGRSRRRRPARSPCAS